MFSKDVIQQDNFLDMPLSAQALYFHLGLNADDDGFIQPKFIMRMLGISDDDLKILIIKGFVIPMDEGVHVITHWRMSNELKTDRYKPTVFQDQFKKLSISADKKYLTSSNSDWKQNVSKMSPESIQDGNIPYPQYSVVKTREKEIKKDKSLPKKISKEKAFENLDDSLKSEILEVRDFYNEKFKKKTKSIEGYWENYTFWRKEFDLETIKTAITNGKNDSWWKDKLTLEILFRRKNTAGEKVNYIDKLSQQEITNPYFADVDTSNYNF